MSHYTSQPLIVEMQGIFTPSEWDSMPRERQGEYLHVLIRAVDNAEKPLYIVSDEPRSLGATILSVSTATAYNRESAAGGKSAASWDLSLNSPYSGVGDVALARDIYCFQHYAEKFLDVAGEASSASNVCNPDVTAPQLYNRDGMLGDRTQTLLQNFAASKGTKVGESGSFNSETQPELVSLGNKLVGALSWVKLDEIKQALTTNTPPPVQAPPPASDMGQEYIDLYNNMGRRDLIPASQLPALPGGGGGSGDGGGSEPAKDFEGDENEPKRNDDKKNKETNWLLWGGIGLGVVAAALILTQNSAEDEYNPY